MPVHNTSVVHVGPGHYDYGQGYGIAQNKYHKPRSRGDIYSPKSEWDRAIQQEEYEKSLNSVNKKDIEKAIFNLIKRLGLELNSISTKLKSKKNMKNIDAEFETKAFSSHFQSANDPMPYHDKFSNVGAAGAGHTTINAGVDKIDNEKLIRECIRNLIVEIHFNGAKNTGSGNSNLYPRKHTIGSGINSGNHLGTKSKRSVGVATRSTDGVKGHTIHVDCEVCDENNCECETFNLKDDFVTPGSKEFYLKLDISNLNHHKKNKHHK